eukprot:TRINITY_DN1388_c0_g3_i1.p1 TRINITY_DN1388_c0_g3~~TRINITY_DN1388_c0_g3_i1.p1  ORF type:complete len:400 (-),score=62.44 TRINITY_DN1388_c0_g3_i1:116-1315(-)
MCKQESPAATPTSVDKLPELPTLGEIKKAIPAHCFERSTARSLSLVLRDGCLIAALFFSARLLLRLPGGEDGPLRLVDWIGWALYGFWQGTCFTGWWVLAHECGHGGFSASTLVNDVVGWVLHSILCVPYFSWQYSHSKHHSKTNHLLDGESHVPDLLEELLEVKYPLMHAIMGDDAFAIFQLVGHLVFGWPMYLLFNVTGGRRLQGKTLSKPLVFGADHFNPMSALFPEGWGLRIALSTLGVSLTIAGLVWACSIWGVAAVGVMYFHPYLWCNFWLVLYTWLQHTDPTVPHFGEDTFTWLRGALSTIDRPYGVFDWFHHYIGSTHVCHHVFSKLPCYHATEATKHMRAFLEPKGLYNYDGTPWPIAAWKVAKTCHFVEGVDGVQYFKAMNDLKKAKKM